MSEREHPLTRSFRPRGLGGSLSARVLGTVVVLTTTIAAGLITEPVIINTALAASAVAPPANAKTIMADEADSTDLADSGKETSTPAPAIRVAPKPGRVVRIADPRIASTTGLVASAQHKGIYWTASGTGLFAIDSTGRTVAAYTLPGGAGLDVQALTLGKDENGRPLLLIADTGDPKATRKTGVNLLTAPEPARLTGGALRVQRYVLNYPEGPRDARTLLYEPKEERLYLLTNEGTQASLYTLPLVLGPRVANKMIKLRTLYVSSEDGAVLPDGRVVLRGPDYVYVYPDIRGEKIANVKVPRTAGGALAAGPDGRSIMVTSRTLQAAGAGTGWQLGTFSLQGVPVPTPSASNSLDGPAPRITVEKSPLPGGVVGTLALAGLAVIALIGALLPWRAHRRRRRSAHR